VNLSCCSSMRSRHFTSNSARSAASWDRSLCSCARFARCSSSNLFWKHFHSLDNTRASVCHIFTHNIGYIQIHAAFLTSGAYSSDSDSVYWTCSQKTKNQRAKQTIMHCTTKQYNTRQEMKWNAMQLKKWTKDSDIGLLVF